MISLNVFTLYAKKLPNNYFQSLWLLLSMLVSTSFLPSSVSSYIVILFEESEVRLINPLVRSCFMTRCTYEALTDGIFGLDIISFAISLVLFSSRNKCNICAATEGLVYLRCFSFELSSVLTGVGDGLLLLTSIYITLAYIRCTYMI